MQVTNSAIINVKQDVSYRKTGFLRACAHQVDVPGTEDTAALNEEERSANKND
jgi:hypothetical protein